MDTRGQLGSHHEIGDASARRLLRFGSPDEGLYNRRTCESAPPLRGAGPKYFDPLCGKGTATLLIRPGAVSVRRRMSASIAIKGIDSIMRRSRTQGARRLFS